MRVNIKKIIDLRQKLHKHAELSLKEEYTAKILKNYIKNLKPDQIIENLGDTPSFAVIFKGKEDSDKNIVFRAELDALPIEEKNNLPYRSINKEVSHKCGHDGHSAILTALAEAISYNRPKDKNIILLFQSAEEILEGAKRIMDDKNFKNLNPSYIIGFHNIPESDENTIILKEKNITFATIGMTIEFFTSTSAAYNPNNSFEFSEIGTSFLAEIKNIISSNSFKSEVLITPVYSQTGKPHFGLAPSYLKFMLTLRAAEYRDLDRLIGFVQDTTKFFAKKNNFNHKISYSDEAPPVYNNPQLTEKISKIATLNGFNVKKHSFKFGEDFGYYTIKYKGVFFGFGTKNKIPLHNENYDFDDNSIYNIAHLLFEISQNL